MTKRRVWALADPHLGFALNKPMDVFGSRWEAHEQRLAEAWRACVAEEDWVLMAGDLSWAINFEELRPDFAFLQDLPGQKIISRGNHDYWWASLKKAEDFARSEGFDRLHFVRNTAIRLPQGVVVAGTRSWTAPGSSDWKGTDQKLFDRELHRVDLCLAAMDRVAQEGDRRVLMLHYPPFSKKQMENPLMTRLLESEIELCVFGHVHGHYGGRYRQHWIEGKGFFNTACDVLEFKPLLLYEEKELCCPLSCCMEQIEEA